MRSGKSIFSAVVGICIWFIASCGATAYQPKGFTGGYTDTHIKDNIYFVEISCNAFTSQTTAVQYLHRRAMEVCKENGYCDYRIQGERDATGIGFIGSYGSGHVSGGTMEYPGRNAYIECIRCPKNR